MSYPVEGRNHMFLYHAHALALGGWVHDQHGQFAALPSLAPSVLSITGGYSAACEKNINFAIPGSYAFGASGPRQFSLYVGHAYSEVRGTALLALQRWISRSADHDSALLTRLRTECHCPEDRAKLLVQLLHPFSPEAIERNEAQAQVLDYLDHDNLAIRVLAFWHAQVRLGTGCGQRPVEDAWPSPAGRSPGARCGI